MPTIDEVIPSHNYTWRRGKSLDPEFDAFLEGLIEAHAEVLRPLSQHVNVKDLSDHDLVTLMVKLIKDRRPEDLRRILTGVRRNRPAVFTPANLTTNEGETILTAAVRGENLEMLAVILQDPYVDVNFREGEALREATENGWVDGTEMLLKDQRIDIFVQDDNEKNLYEIAEDNAEKHPEIFRMFQQKLKGQPVCRHSAEEKEIATLKRDATTTRMVILALAFSVAAIALIAEERRSPCTAPDATITTPGKAAVGGVQPPEIKR